MTTPPNYIIKSFKHNGRLHRMWLNNLRVPDELLGPGLADEKMIVTVNCHSRIVEADGSEWYSKNPGVSFFIPGQWYNIVALIESAGIRYYCNIASPPYVYGHVLTYIDYDLDLIRTPSGEKYLVDQEEYERHRINYHYSTAVEEKVKEGLMALTERMDRQGTPFQDREVHRYYEWWKNQTDV
ncbi:DUF402 domain-containing protein [Paenibacillus aurantius]|uniref:DUF402 domain-containing protein n=1 Tax=Paenibacillus aurantius TaxID=2918900 RepID=A0AA96LF47_9BACL|nr:DUF402 domain-containing protein [Paenibacillus aurantius]WNQ12105.1 DUF402 domain-containing protein [Paenibacillus aurantius]